MTTCPTCDCNDCIRQRGFCPCPNGPSHDDAIELRTLLSARPGETVLEAAERWRETVKWYGDLSNWGARVDMNNICDSILNGEIATENDMGQRARELIGEGKPVEIE